MSREIKFRGRRVGEKEWVHGGFSKYREGNCFITAMGKDHISYIGRHQEVEKETVGQFTGILDKNNKEIYEGDIVRRDGYWDMYCVWDEEKCQFKFLCTDWVVTQGHSHYLSKSTLEQHEVIGNIYENPEFIK